MNIHSSLHHAVCRSWVEPSLRPKHLIYPLFVTSNKEDKDIQGFTPNKQWGMGEDKQYGSLVAHLTNLMKRGLKAVMLFGVVPESSKNDNGMAADSDATPVILVGKILSKKCPSLLICFDVCLCEYTDHGHCAPLRKTPTDNEQELIDSVSGCERLANIALAYARAGAHVVCPSDMMDGRIKAIREKLDKHNFQHVSIMSYTSKKASIMYAPFRDAVESTFKGNRKQYQQPTGSTLTAEKALKRDLYEGADSIIVKPSLFYGDIIKSFSQTANVPVVAYVVSGEYKMLYDYGTSTNSIEDVLKETHVGLLRAGCSVIITYFTPQLLEYLPNWD